MQATPSQPDADGQQPAIVWSSETRSWVSLLLFAHLFAVVVAVTTYTGPSDVQVRLHGLFGPYLRNLHLSPCPASYQFARFYLTHAEPSDIDYTIEFDTKNNAGAVEHVTIPPAGLVLPTRQRRYQALANAAGTLASGEDVDDIASVLPRAVGGSMLKHNGTTDGTIRLRAHYLPDINELGQNEARRQAALNNYRDIYEAQVLGGGGTVDIIKKSTTLESAPVRTPGPIPNTTPNVKQP